MPEAKDLAFVIAACIAGCFSYLVALNAKDAAITMIRVKWLEDVKEKTAEYLSSLNLWVSVNANIEELKKELESLGKRPVTPFIIEERNRLLGKEFEMKTKVDEHFYKLRVCQNRLIIELNPDKKEFSRVLTGMDRTRKILNRLNKSGRLGSEASRVFYNLDFLRERSKRAYKSEWEDIKRGDKDIVAKKKRILLFILVLVIGYGGYVFYYAASIDATKEIFLLNGLRALSGC